MITKRKFKVIQRTVDECEHDTGVVHSLGMTCEESERNVERLHMLESDPLHQEAWHTGLTDLGNGLEINDSPICQLCYVPMVLSAEVYVCKHCGSVIPLEWYYG